MQNLAQPPFAWGLMDWNGSMADRPIIFSAPMVRAMLDGRKTQTRRLLKPQPDGVREIEYHGGTIWSATPLVLDNPIVFRAPNYAAHDRLYVREAFRGPYAYEVNKYPLSSWGNKALWLCADGEPPEAVAAQFWPKGRPSIHMPRWASRLTLLVEDVRVERLQEISEADAIAEGICAVHGIVACHAGGGIHQEVYGWRYFLEGDAMDDGDEEASTAYLRLWDQLHTQEGERSSDNPFVVAVSFSVVRGNIDQVLA